MLLTKNFKLKISFLVAFGTFQVLSSHMWMMAVVLDSTKVEHCHHHRKFCWTALV